MRIARVALPLLLAALACDHPAPPEPGGYTPGGPFNTVAPRQLTFSPGPDLSPAWLPDGSGIIYQFLHLDQPDGDRCLGILPPEGGTQRAEICSTGVASDDSTDAYGEPAVSSAGRLFFTRASSLTRLQNSAPAYQSAAVAPLATPAAVQTLRTLPYTVNGRQHYGIAQVRWLGDTAVVYVAQNVAYLTGCFGCNVDTMRTGIELARMDLKSAPGTVTVVPGTDSASSVALGGGDTIYYTVAGDSRVFRRTFAGGDTAVWDFGAAGIARDVQVRGATLYAAVGGAVAYFHDPSLGPVQRDTGGVIHVVNLGLATDTAITAANRMYRRIALSPDGRHIVAEGYDVGIPKPQANLWLIDVP
jgi:hypothetical protein